MDLFSKLFASKIFLAAFWAWLSAQFIKTFFYFIRYKSVRLRIFLLGSGGMPSAHSATVSALAWAIGRTQGWDAPIFIVSLIIAIIVIFDSVGVRNAASQQARILNIMIEEYMHSRKISHIHLKELLGHTPIQVFVGILLGIFVATIIT